jgi:hypothetical protein
MKTGLHSSLLKTVLLLVSLASSIGSLATSQAGTSDAFFVGPRISARRIIVKVQPKAIYWSTRQPTHSMTVDWYF